MATTSGVVDVKVGDGEMAIFTDAPEGSGNRPAVIVIQEIFGVNDHMKDVASRFAAEGYFAAAPDLFHRAGRNVTVPFEDTQTAFGLRGALSNDDILADLNATVDCLKNTPGVDADNIGIVGFCFGGRVSFLSACNVSEIKAASVFYGGRILAPMGGSGPSPLE